ncbi:hypothetical protein KY349_04735 [Candidatus Woesearchaeota archaeon]|nr:hypothetical protein [Candidatus Woesearchaeota archaeon]
MAKKKSNKRKVKKAKQKKVKKAKIKTKSKPAKKTKKKTVKKKTKSQKRSIKKRASPKKRLKKAKPAKKKAKVTKKKAKPAKKKAEPKIRIVKPKPVEVITFEQQVKKAKPAGEFHKHVDSIDKEIAEYKKALEAQGAAPPMPVSAAEVEKEEEKVEKQLKKPGKRGPIMFYLISSLICIAVLAYLFGTLTTGIFYFLFGMFLWWWSHLFHITRSGAWKAFFSLGVLIPFLYMFYWYFNDFLSLLVLIMYAMSLVIAGFLYFYHVRRELAGEIHRSFARTLLVMFYSHIMAFTAASALAYGLSYVLFTDSFVSIAFVLLAWLLPVLLVYFFLTKFLYLRFFDQKHIKRDLKKGVVHGAIYCFILIILLLGGYLLTAFQLAGEEQKAYDETFNAISGSLSAIDSDISGFAAANNAGDILDLKVTKDLKSLSGQMLQGATDIKAELDATRISFDDYLSDDYFTTLSRNRILLSRSAGVAYGVNDVKDDLFREYNRVKAFEETGEFDDSTKDIDEHYYYVISFVNDAYMPYEESDEVLALREKVSGSINSYSGLLADQSLLEFNLVFHPDMTLFVAGESRFSQRFYDVIYHTAVFRDFMVLVFNNILSQLEETVDPYPVQYLYRSAGEESTLSSVLRYRIVKSNIDATASLSV